MASRFQIPSLDFRNVSLSTNNLDGEPPLTPGLFDRVALAGLRLPKPATVTLAPATAIILNDVTIKTEAYQPLPLQPLPLNLISSQDTNRSNESTKQFVNNNTNGSVYANNVNMYSGDNNMNNDEVANNNTNTGHGGGNNNSSAFIDFDESIFEDWISDDTEMDFIDSTDDPCYKSSYDYLMKGCAATTAGFCASSRAPTRPYEYDTRRNGIYEQNTNSSCCGFPLGYSSEILEARRPSLTQQAVQTQPQANQHQMKSAGFTNAVRSLGGRICGPALIDSSYLPLDGAYSSNGNPDCRIYPGQLQQRQDRSYSPMAGMAEMSNDQASYFRNSLDTVGTTSTGSRSSGYSQNFGSEVQPRNTINSYFASSPSGHSSNTPSTPYMNPIYRFVTSAPPASNTING